MYDTEPSEKTEQYVVTKLDIQILDLKLNESVLVLVSLYDEHEVRVSQKQIVISGDEYNAWGSDDQYLLTLIASKFGLTIIN